MDNSFCIVLHLKAKPEQLETVMERLSALVAATRLESGCVYYRPHQANDDPCHFIIYECWRDREALDFHMRQEYLTEFLADGGHLLAEQPSGCICRELMSKA